MNKAFVLFAALIVSLVAAGATTAADTAGHEPVTVCHMPGTPAQHSIVVDDDSVVQAHLEHGDTLGDCVGEPPPCPEGTVLHGDDCVPVDEEPPPDHGGNPPPPPVHPPTTLPPTGHTCAFVGADKDGGHDVFGGTNDDCAPRPTPPSSVTVPTPPLVITVEKIVEKLVPGPERVVTKIVKVKSKPKVVTRVVVRNHTKVVYRDRIKCPPYTKLVNGICMTMGSG